MADPQDRLKVWLRRRLRARGPGSCRALAERLNLPADAVTRMQNRDGGKEQRRIEAHLVPKMAAFFGEWPPGFEHMEDKTPAAELVAKAKKAKGKSRRVSQSATKDVVVQGVEGPVTVIDNSTNVAGDSATIAGNGPAALSDEAGELMGAVTQAVDAIHRAMKKKLSIADLGRIALERHMAIMAACQAPEEYPHALEIMKLRLRRQLATGKAG